MICIRLRRWDLLKAYGGRKPEGTQNRKSANARTHSPTTFQKKYINTALPHRRESRFVHQSLFRADAATRWSSLYVSELCAGAALRLAGCSSGRCVCARISLSGTFAFLLPHFVFDHAYCLQDVAFLFLRSYDRSSLIRKGTPFCIGVPFRIDL